MLALQWIKSRADTWLNLQTMDLSTIGDTFGVYVIWHGGNPSQVVRVGQGDIADRLSSHRGDRDVCAYAQHTLFVTWASVPAHQVDGVERHLADRWSPLVGDAWPNCTPIAVNSPWG
jgi:hypothetical protein